MPSVSSTLKDSGLVTFDLKEQETNPTPKAEKRDDTTDNLSEGNEGNVICEESLDVDVLERGRVNLDLTELGTNPDPKAGKREEMADNLSQENEENVIYEQGLAVDIDEQQRDVEDTWL